MARGRKKVSTETLDEKIEQQKSVLEKAKAKYETEKENLAELIKLRKEMRKEELMEAVIKANAPTQRSWHLLKGRQRISNV